MFLFDAGAGVFVTAVVAGTIAIIHPFDAMQRPFLRDIVFYLAAVFWTFSVMWDKEITKIEAIGQAYLQILNFRFLLSSGLWALRVLFLPTVENLLTFVSAD